MSGAGWLIAGLIFSGCAGKPVAPPIVDVPRARSISVEPFEGDLHGEITRAFVQALRSGGVNVVDGGGRPDAVLSGGVNTFKSGRRLMIYLGETKLLANGQIVTVSNPIVTRSGSQIVPKPEGANPHIVAESAALALAVRLTEASTGSLLWAQEFSYESLDPAIARQATVGTLSTALLRAMPKWPARQVKKD